MTVVVVVFVVARAISAPRVSPTKTQSRSIQAKVNHKQSQPQNSSHLALAGHAVVVVVVAVRRSVLGPHAFRGTRRGQRRTHRLRRCCSGRSHPLRGPLKNPREQNTKALKKKLPFAECLGLFTFFFFFLPDCGEAEGRGAWTAFVAGAERRLAATTESSREELAFAESASERARTPRSEEEKSSVGPATRPEAELAFVVVVVVTSKRKTGLIKSCLEDHPERYR